MEELRRAEEEASRAVQACAEALGRAQGEARLLGEAGALTAQAQRELEWSRARISEMGQMLRSIEEALDQRRDDVSELRRRQAEAEDLFEEVHECIARLRGTAPPAG